MILLIHFLIHFYKEALEALNNNGTRFTHENVALLYYYFMKMDIRRAESYVKSPDWIANKGTTINPKNEKDNKYFQWSTTSGLIIIKLRRNI